MTKAVIDAGICGCTITVEVIKLSRRKVRVTIAGDCDMVNQKHIIVFQPSLFGMLTSRVEIHYSRISRYRFFTNVERATS
jgi:hypothetical protein